MLIRTNFEHHDYIFRVMLHERLYYVFEKEILCVPI